MLSLAWDDCAADTDMLLNALNARLASARMVEDGDLSSSSSNSHTATSNQPGENTITDAEEVRGWSQIIQGFRVTRQFLQDCAFYGLDAFTIKCAQVFPNPLPAAAASAVTVDTKSRWARLAAFNDIAAAKIVGVAVGDEAVYCWLMDNPDLLNIDTGVREARSDFSQGIIGRTGGLLYA